MPNPLTRPLSLPWDGALRKAAALVVGRQRGGMTVGSDWGAPLWGSWRNNAKFDYRAAVGDPLGNSIVVACLEAIARYVPEPRLRVYQIDPDGDDTVLPRHPLQTLLRRPNPHINTALLMKWIAYCLHLDGNAYLYKQRSAAGRVVQLWPLAPATIEPAWPQDATTDEWITHYDYRPDADGGEPIRLLPTEVIHARLNMDPHNMRKGRSPLWAGFKHLFADEEATAFTGAMLRNFGVPGVILSPNPQALGGAAGGPSLEDVQRVKEQYRQSFGGENRGEPMVTGGPFNVSVVSFSPQQMNLDTLQLMPEARVCALLGVPPVIAGLMVGLNNARDNNTDELRQHFVASKLIPYWSDLDETLSHALVPDFGDPDQLRIAHDLSDVRALQEDMDKKYERVTKFMLAGGMLVNEARQELSMAPLPDLDVLYVPSNVTATDPAEILAEPEPVPAALPNQQPAGLLEDGRQEEEEQPQEAPADA